jgi:hypothetical protein
MTDINTGRETYKLRKSEIQVCLRVTEFECSPDEISKILSITPSNTWLKGELIDKTKRATIRHKQNGWEICSRLFDESLNNYSELQPHISNILDTVRPYRNNFKQLPSGSFVELSCVIYAYSEQTPAIHIDAVSVYELAYISASIDVDYYYLVD